MKRRTLESDARCKLRVKIKSLAAEARMIRREEKTASPSMCNELHSHRVGPVRSEARSALIAYGFIRGRSYAQIEPGAKTGPNWKRVETLVVKYGNFRGLYSSNWEENCHNSHVRDQTLKERVLAWISDAKKTPVNRHRESEQKGLSI